MRLIFSSFLICFLLFILNHPLAAQQFGSGKDIAPSCSACAIDVARVVDLDADGDQDILVGSHYPYIGWFEKTGAGFSEMKIITENPGGSFGASISTAGDVITSDLNNDGLPDLITGRVMYLNQGNGRFSSAKNIGDFENAFTGESATADFDNDGLPDIVNTSTFGIVGLWWYNNGPPAGYFGPIDLADTTDNTFRRDSISTGFDPLIQSKIDVADIDGDGDQDILTSNGGFKDILLGWNENLDDTAAFGEYHIIDEETGDQSVLQPTSISGADLDGDGDTDVLSTHNERGIVAWYENTDGKGSFSSQNIINTPPNAERAEAAIAIDADGDGDLDVVSKSYRKIALYENQGGGSFGSQVVIAEGSGISFGPFDTGDVNEDGLTDIVYPNRTTGQVVWQANEAGGTFGTPQYIGRDKQLANIQVVESGDLNNDGADDLVISTRPEEGGESMYKLANTGSGYGEPEQFTETNLTVSNILIDSIDDDNYADIIFTGGNVDAGTGALSRFRNEGISMDFTFKQITAGCGYSTDLRLVDVDDDGDRDVILNESFNGNINVYQNIDGQISSESPVPIYSGTGSISMDAADFDGDGDKDIVVRRLATESAQAKIVYYEDTGNDWYWPEYYGETPQSDFADGIVVDEGRNIRGVEATDVDGDGDLDIFSQNRWYENTGGGSFSAPKTIFNNHSSATRYEYVDLDADGDKDIIGFKEVEQFTYADIEDDTRDIWWVENGGGTFGPRQVLIEDIKRPNRIFVSDVNTDGAPDILFASVWNDNLTWFPNTGVSVERKQVSGSGTVSFSKPGAHIKFPASTSGSGYVSVTRSLGDQVIRGGLSKASLSQYRFLFKKEGALQLSDSVSIYFDLSKTSDINSPQNIKVYQRDVTDEGDFDPVPTEFNEGGNELVAKTAHFGEFVFVNEQPPLALADTIKVTEDLIWNEPAPGVLNNDSDPEDEQLVANQISEVTNGQLTFSDDGSFTYIPNAGFVGTDTFTYEANDGESGAPQTVVIQVKSNEVPYRFGDQSGWNLIGLPFNSNTVQDFPSDETWDMYNFQVGNYLADRSLDPGKGYWFRIQDNNGFTVLRRPQDSITVDLEKGWNLISGPGAPLSVYNIEDPEQILLPNTLYGFENAYQAVDSVRAGKGFWIRTTTAGSITMEKDTLSPEEQKPKKTPTPVLNKNKVEKQFNKLLVKSPNSTEQVFYFEGELPDDILKASFSLPPKPPESAFDARWQEGYQLTESSEPQLEFQSAESPITLKLKEVKEDHEVQYKVRSFYGKELLDEGILSAQDSVQLHHAGNLSHLTLSAMQATSNQQGSQLPEQYELKQNYPNPFNPSTNIEFGLPKAAFVEMVVYDITGRKVATLVHEDLKAGWHTVTFSADNLASGMYIYRIETPEWSKTQKLMFIK